MYTVAHAQVIILIWIFWDYKVIKGQISPVTIHERYFNCIPCYWKLKCMEYIHFSLPHESWTVTIPTVVIGLISMKTHLPYFKKFKKFVITFIFCDCILDLFFLQIKCLLCLTIINLLWVKIWCWIIIICFVISLSSPVPLETARDAGAATEDRVGISARARGAGDADRAVDRRAQRALPADCDACRRAGLCSLLLLQL